MLISSTSLSYMYCVLTPKLDETFASPQQATDIVQKMCAYGGIRLDESQPVQDSYISKGVRCSAIMRPVVDREIGVSASIRRQKTVAITRDNLLKSNTALAEELDFLSICVNSGVSVGYAGIFLSRTPISVVLPLPWASHHCLCCMYSACFEPLRTKYSH